MSSLDSLKHRLAELRDLFRSWGAEPQARTLDAVIAEIESDAEEAGRQLLSLGEAAARTGYSADHLARLVRQERIPNAGRPHAPRIRAGDLPPPKQRRRVAGPSPPAYDPDADARSLMSRRGGQSS